MNIVRDLIVIKMLQYEMLYFNRTPEFSFAMLAATSEILQADISGYTLSVLLGFSSPIGPYEFETSEPVDSFWVSSCDVVVNGEFISLIKGLRISIKYNEPASW